MSTFTVKTCSVKKELPDNGHGAKKVLNLTLIDPSGVETQAEWFTNQTTPNPEPESRLEGTLEASDYGPKFKKAQQGQGQRGNAWTPEREAAVTRQHGQEMALRYAVLLQSQGVLSRPFTLDELWELVDEFDRDVTDAKTHALSLGAKPKAGQATQPATQPQLTRLKKDLKGLSWAEIKATFAQAGVTVNEPSDISSGGLSLAEASAVIDRIAQGALPSESSEKGLPGAGEGEFEHEPVTPEEIKAAFDATEIGE